MKGSSYVVSRSEGREIYWLFNDSQAIIERDTVPGEREGGSEGGRE